MAGGVRRPQQHVIGGGIEVPIAAFPQGQQARGVAPVGGDGGQGHHKLALVQGVRQLLGRGPPQDGDEPQLLLPGVLDGGGCLGCRLVGAVIQQGDLPGGLHAACLLQQGLGLLAQGLVVIRLIVDETAAALAEIAAHGVAQPRRDNALGGVQRLVLRQRVPVDGQGQGPAQGLAFQAAGPLVQQQQGGLGIGIGGVALRQVHSKVHVAAGQQVRPGLAVRLEPELQHVRPQAAGVIVPVGRLGGEARLVPAGGPIGAVGQQGLGVQGPVLPLRRVAAHRHGGRPGADIRQEIGALVGELHHEGEVVRGGHLKKASVLLGLHLVKARHHVQQSRMGGGGGRVRQPLPGIDKVVGGDGLPVGPADVLPQGEGIGLGAVQVVLHGVGFGGGVNRLDAAVLPPGELHEIFKQVGHHRAFGIGGGHGGVQGGRGGVQAHPQGHGVPRLGAAGQSQHAQHQQQGHVPYPSFHRGHAPYFDLGSAGVTRPSSSRVAGMIWLRVLRAMSSSRMREGKSDSRV